LVAIGNRLLLLVLGSVIFLSTHPASAQTPAAKLAELNKKAMEEYDSLEFDSAKKMLLEAAKLAVDNSLTVDALWVSTQLNLGIVMGAGFDDNKGAFEYFTAALKVDRTAKLDPTRATPALEKTFADALAKLPPPKPVEPKSLFVHQPVDEVVENTRVQLKVKVDADLGATAVTLYYHASGKAVYESVAMMENVAGEYSGTIPAEQVKGNSLQYYIEAQDGEGNHLTGFGSESSPTIISVLKPREKTPPGPTTKPAAVEDDSIVSIGIFVGTGGGVVSGGNAEHWHPTTTDGTNSVKITPPGLALSPLHIAADVSIHLNTSWQIGAMLRIQVLNALENGTGTTRELGNPISFLGLVRAKVLFGEGRIRPYATFGLGGGQLRHRVRLGDYNNASPDNPTDVIDSRVAGPFAFGGGGGVIVMFSQHVGFVVEGQAIFLVPTFAAHLDLNLGLLFSF